MRTAGLLALCLVLLAPLAGAQDEDSDVVAEIERRRDWYISQGYPRDIAAQKALSELAPAPPPVIIQREEAPKPKTGRDNMRDFLDMREREKAEQRRQQEEWRRRSDALDAEREAEQQAADAERRRADCEERRRHDQMRNGYSNIRCY